MQQGRYGEAVKLLEEAIKKHPIASYWRALADASVGNRDFSKASEAYLKAAAIYRNIGDPNAAKVLEMKAQRYETKVLLFYHRSAQYKNVKRGYTKRRLEPVYGTYLGAFIDREDKISRQFLDENWQTHKDVGEFNNLVGKPHAIFFIYLSYGQPFPTKWTEHLKQYKAAAHFAFEPKSLDEVTDNAYLREFASQAKKSGIPIFIRFAGEMNGAWTPYHGNPARYIQKFRLVAKVFHENAPNVAMVWCVNDIPEHEITKYYPGEAAVDWVGVNFYSVLYNDNNPNRPAEWKNPADSLRFVYKKYAAKHPIMIGEYAATHRSKVDMIPRTDFAINKIGQLYSALPHLYPRVKAVHWLSMDTMKHAMPGRQLNNYSLLEEPDIFSHYRSVVSSAYFLESVSVDQPAMASEEIVPLTKGTILSGKVTLSTYVKSYLERPKVVVWIGGKKAKTFQIPSLYLFSFDTRSYPNGWLQIKLIVQGEKGKSAGRKSVRVILKN